LKKENEIEERIREAENRYDIAVHYQIPYPKPMMRTTVNQVIQE
jgi:hypothetical protein